METRVDLFESLVDKAEAYARTTYELSKFKTLETITVVVTSLVSRLIVLSTISLFIVVLSIGIAFLLGDLLGKTYYGFFIVAAFYLLAGIVLKLFLHKWIKKPISELIIVKALQ
ncbi:MAG: hypothetical protein SH848_19610 [Saprospiraceae bacterium]|nr:hypothetical protein [Saprospiraceae bacterium]MDZ4706145.1 hypothetical protein [Saprospiraceae bacterium]